MIHGGATSKILKSHAGKVTSANTIYTLENDSKIASSVIACIRIAF